MIVVVNCLFINAGMHSLEHCVWLLISIVIYNVDTTFSCGQRMYVSAHKYALVSTPIIVIAPSSNKNLIIIIRHTECILLQYSIM